MRVHIAVILSLLLAFAAESTCAQSLPQIAIIIDDLGYKLQLGKRVTQLPGPVSCAILPAAPRAGALAEAAHASGKDVLLHLPLQALDERGGSEPGGIVLDMSRGQFAHTFATSLAAVPHAIGVNTHRGSLLTQHPGHMRWLMEEIDAAGDLFFVDSYTTHESVALSMAKEAGVPALKRDVFLDPDQTAATVLREFARLKKVARQRGSAVGIGHPYPETIALLERELPQLAADGFEFVSVSQLIASQRQKLAQAAQ